MRKSGSDDWHSTSNAPWRNDAQCFETQRRPMVSCWLQGECMRSAYSAIFTIGILASFLWLGWIGPPPERPAKGRKRDSPRLAEIDAGLVALLLGLLGARAGFVFLHWEHFSSYPVEMLWFWQGGLSWTSGALTAILGIGLYAAVGGHSFWSLTDSLALPSGFVALSAWSGCYLDGCAYGMHMPQRSWTPPIGDMFGGFTSRWPTQLVGIVSSVVILLLLFALFNMRPKRGVLGTLSLSTIAAAAFALSFTRADPALLIRGIRLDTLGSAFVLLVALLGFVYCILKKDESI
jgi:phosphatidylglycerol:prolipoprotein diacylglycerol transferase